MPMDDLAVAPGQRISGVLETAAFCSGIKVGIPVIAVRGDEEGPALTVLAGQHGRELNGIEAIRRVLLQLDPRHGGAHGGNGTDVALVHDVHRQSHPVQHPAGGDQALSQSDGRTGHALTRREATELGNNAHAQRNGFLRRRINARETLIHAAGGAGCQRTTDRR